MTVTEYEVQPLRRDIRQAAATLSDQEARFLVDLYYQAQKERITASARRNQAEKAAEPHLTLDHLLEQRERIERQVQSSLDAYSLAHPLGRWMREIPGIGPVIAAGCLAYLVNDPKGVPETVGHWYSFAGIRPGIAWERGQQRPWSTTLKTLCWKLGESFVKVKNRDGDVYGQIYDLRKAYEEAKNEAGDYAEQAAAGAKRVGKDTEAYKAYSVGKLPPGHLHARAKRYAVKIFLSHLHEAAYVLANGAKPPAPFPIAHLGHAHKIEIPYPELLR